MRKFIKKEVLWIGVLALLASIFITTVSQASSLTQSPTILEEWSSLPVPPVPPFKPVKLDSATTAVLVLDIVPPTCKVRPRCLASIPKIQELLLSAREKGVMVVYSITMTTKAEDIFLEVYPAPDDPIVQTTVDKFYKTDLDSILKEKGIKTVVITGTAANGAVLHTAVGAALNGYQVVLPVDGMSATEPYAEQYTAFHMLNSPGTRNKAVLTKVGLITF